MSKKNKKPAPKKPAKKPSPSKKPKPVSKKSVKPASKKPTAPAKPAPNPGVKKTAAPPPPAAKAPKPAAESAARASLRSRILAQSRAKAHPRPAEFSLDDALTAARAAAKAEATTKAAAKATDKSAKAAALAAKAAAKPATPNHVKAASLADILGFNPRKAAPSHEDDSAIPEKFRRYYRLLIDLRRHLTGQIDQHTEDTLKRSSKDDAGDLSSYGQHMADAGTDTFDRDFALSLVSSEQEALTEIDAAIKRIHDGTYGVCEITQKPIAKERLLAVPFTRYSAEAQKELERNRHRARTQAGLFGEMGDEGGKREDDGGGGDD
jgi:RNA polymerase-binding transcription factor DksA